MSKSDRLNHLTALLQDGKTHRARDLAATFGVTERTIYRDMARLQANGVPVRGTPGEGYAATAELTLPPLSLTGAELDVLRLGLGVIADAGDAAQQQAARDLAEKLEFALGDGQAQVASTPLVPNAQLQQHLGLIRQAITTRQRLRVTLHRHTSTIRPLRLDYFGRIWKCICWDETAGQFAALPINDLRMLAVLPSLFVDEPGKTLHDYLVSP